MTNTPSSNRYSVMAVLGVFVLALIGVGFLVLAVALLVKGTGGTASSANPTHAAIVATQVVLIPTTTQSPPTATTPPTQASTATAPPASDTPAASATSALAVKITRPANVRTGPGLTYPPVGGLNTGDTAPVIGRDSSAQWFAISFANAPKGTGWVSALVATFDGTINNLPVIEAAAPPPPQATAVPPTNAPPADTQPAAATNTPVVQGAGGIQTLLFQMHKTTGAPNESIFFDFKVVNNTANVITYGLLAAHTDVGVTAASWSAPLQPGKVLSWTDHINFPSAGSYQVYLGICYDSLDTCKHGGTWVRLSNSTTVTIQ